MSTAILPYRRSIARGLILAVTWLFLNGCGRGANVAMFKQRPDTDVTLSDEYNFADFACTVWKTKVKMALGDIEAYTGEHHITLLPPRSYDPAHPNYTPPPCLDRVIVVLPVNTRFQFHPGFFGCEMPVDASLFGV